MRELGVQRYRVFWSDGRTTDVEVESGARALYKDENGFEIAAALACVEAERQREYIRDVKEI